MTENDRYILETLDEIKARCEAEEHMGEVAALIAARHAVEREMARMDIADSKMVIADKADMDELEAYRKAKEEIMLKIDKCSEDEIRFGLRNALYIQEKHLRLQQIMQRKN